MKQSDVVLGAQQRQNNKIVHDRTFRDKILKWWKTLFVQRKFFSLDSWLTTEDWCLSVSEPSIARTSTSGLPWKTTKLLWQGELNERKIRLSYEEKVAQDEAQDERERGFESSNSFLTRSNSCQIRAPIVWCQADSTNCVVFGTNKLHQETNDLIGRLSSSLATPITLYLRLVHQPSTGFLSYRGYYSYVTNPL